MDYETALVNEFCNQIAKMQHGFRAMSSWYIFSDKRPGSLTNRFNHDAADHADYMKLFQP